MNKDAVLQCSITVAGNYIPAYSIPVGDVADVASVT